MIFSTEPPARALRAACVVAVFILGLLCALTQRIIFILLIAPFLVFVVWLRRGESTSVRIRMAFGLVLYCLIVIFVWVSLHEGTQGAGLG